MHSAQIAMDISVTNHTASQNISLPSDLAAGTYCQLRLMTSLFPDPRSRLLMRLLVHFSPCYRREHCRKPRRLQLYVRKSWKQYREVRVRDDRKQHYVEQHHGLSVYKEGRTSEYRMVSGQAHKLHTNTSVPIIALYKLLQVSYVCSFRVSIVSLPPSAFVSQTCLDRRGRGVDI